MTPVSHACRFAADLFVSPCLTVLVNRMERLQEHLLRKVESLLFMTEEPPGGSEYQVTVVLHQPLIATLFAAAQLLQKSILLGSVCSRSPGFCERKRVTAVVRLLKQHHLQGVSRLLTPPP